MSVYDSPNDRDALIPYTDAAAPLGNISKPGLHDLFNSGVLETVKIGHKRFTTQAWIDACIQRLRTQEGQLALAKVKGPRNLQRRQAYYQAKAGQ